MGSQSHFALLAVEAVVALMKPLPRASEQKIEQEMARSTQRTGGMRGVSV